MGSGRGNERDADEPLPFMTALRSVGLAAPCDQNPLMSLPKTVAAVLRHHVTLEVEGIDRMYLNVYVPKLQRELGVVGFLRYHRGHLFASSALLAPISDAFVKAIDTFTAGHGIEVLT